MALEPEARAQMTRRYLKMLVIFLLVIGGPLVIYSAWVWQVGQTQSSVHNYETAQQNYESAMRADTYGGKTPEETLKLLISALETGDTTLASKYFLLEQNSNDPNYLTRKKWEDELAQAKAENRISEIVLSLKNVVGDASSATGTTAKFSILINNKASSRIDFVLDAQSGVWKIGEL